MSEGVTGRESLPHPPTLTHSLTHSLTHKLTHERASERVTRLSLPSAFVFFTQRERESVCV